MSEEHCQFCFAKGPDMRTLRFDCSYDAREVVPELVDGEGANKGLYLARFCKYCRSRLLTLMALWRNEAILRRGSDLDSDGCPQEQRPGAVIPYRVNGALYMVTDAEYNELRGPGASPPHRVKP